MAKVISRGQGVIDNSLCQMCQSAKQKEKKSNDVSLLNIKFSKTELETCFYSSKSYSIKADIFFIFKMFDQTWVQIDSLTKLEYEIDSSTKYLTFL